MGPIKRIQCALDVRVGSLILDTAALSKRTHSTVALETGDTYVIDRLYHLVRNFRGGDHAR